MPPSLRPLFVLLLFLFAAARPAAAQVGSSTDIITGVVTGPDGQPLRGATVAVTSLETEITRTRTTNEKGQFTILFPDGGGQYTLTVRFLGMQPATQTLVREADEDRFVVSIRMSRTATTLGPVVVEASRTPARGDDRPTPGSTERSVTGEQLQRLPIDPSDPNAIALLAPGVVEVAGTDTTGAGFSVAGQRPDQNQVTLDGLTFDAGGVPAEAVRQTRVVTNTYDIARGQFTGGQVATTTRGGTNRLAGSFTYGLRDPRLQWVDEEEDEGTGARAATTGAYTQHQLSGGLGGPIVRDRAFWFLSAQLRRRLDALESLLDVGPSTLEAMGANPDSTARFIGLVQGYGLPLRVPDVPDDRTSDNLSVLSRFDVTLSQDHSLMLRLNWSGNLQQGSRLNALDLPHHGGEQSGWNAGAMTSLSSVFGTFLNEFRGVVSRSAREADPYLFGPEGRVFLRSRGRDGVGLAMLDFGGNPGLPTESGDRAYELSNELSWLSEDAAHRFKLGLLLNATDFARVSGNNRSGTFTFNSLADFEANRPASFTRSLASGEREGATLTAAAYIGDTWRRSAALQLTYGVRLETSAYRDRPAYNPDVEAKFGRRTDRFPSDVAVSPRVGFTWSFGRTAQAQQRAERDSAGARRGPAAAGRRGSGPFAGLAGLMGIGGQGAPGALWILRGGIGEFRGRAPTPLFTSALEATGLPSGEITLTCIGSAVPVPDWAAYLDDPSLIPAQCGDGGTGAPTQSSALPAVTVFDPAFSAPRSWRTSLGLTRRVTPRLQFSVDASYALGTRLYGVRDLNLRETPAFTLPAEAGRPVYVPETGIVPGTGATSIAASRAQPGYGQVFEVTSALRSHTTQVTASASGAALRSFLWNLSYTFTDSRDQSSFSGGSAAGGFASATTAGDPNVLAWATSDFERRHSLRGSTTWLARPWIDVTSIIRLSSGSPYTPRVAGDINGDGASRNDRAFVFDPAAAPDTATSNGMARLLDGAPAGARDCLLAQVGGIAGRNSCRNAWTTTLDLQANIRPDLGGAIGRRLQLFVSVVNPLAGLDQLLHGADGLRGWGQTSNADATLLQVRGFDRANDRFVYAVNENFGSDRASRRRLRNPFQLAIQARLQVGRDVQRERLEGFLRGGQGAPGAQGGGFSLATVVNRVAPDPIGPIMARRDTLELTDEQVVRLNAISDSMTTARDSLAARIQREFGAEVRRPADLAPAFPRLQPRLQEARTLYLAAIEQARQVLTPAQWALLPEAIRNPVLMPNLPGGRRRGP